MKRLASVLTLLFLVCMTFVLFFNPIEAIREDLGRHIKLGEIILNSGTVPKVNLLSYTNPVFPFINTHWLSEVVYYIVYSLGGFSLLHLLNAFLATGAILLILIFAYKKTNILAVSLSFLLYFGLLTERIYLRPETFSYLFLSIFLLILYKNKKRFTKWIFLLPIIEFFWVNMHIYFILGFFLVGLFLFDRIVTYDTIFLAQALGKNHKAKKRFLMYLRQTVLPLGIVFVLTFLAMLFNPNGITGALYPFHVFDNYGYTIIENQTIFWLIHNQIFRPSYAFTLITLLLLLLGTLVSLKKRTRIELILVISFSFLAMQAIRNFSLFFFVTFPIFCANITDIGVCIKTRILPKITFQKVQISILSLCLIILLGIAELIYFLPFTGGFSQQLPIHADGAANFFLDHNLKGPIFNNFDIGGYLAYRFYPKEKVFVDNRPEAYPARFFSDVYIPMQNNPQLFRYYTEKYGLNTIIFTYLDHTVWGKHFLNAIVNDPTWKIVYLDDYAVILVKNTWENRDVIQNYGMARGKIRVDRFNPTSKDSIEFLGTFFDIANWGEYQTIMMQKLLHLDPHSCDALMTLPKLYTNAGYPALSNVYANQYKQYCR